MRQYVVDASVVAKWVLSGEPYEENAAKLKDDYVAQTVMTCSPSFMVQEVTNSLWKAIKRKRLSIEKAETALETLHDLEVDLVQLDWLHASEVLKIACKLDITVYDAAYLFLANQSETCFVTADDELYGKAKTQFKTLHIKDY